LLFLKHVLKINILKFNYGLKTCLYKFLLLYKFILYIKSDIFFNNDFLSSLNFIGKTFNINNCKIIKKFSRLDFKKYSLNNSSTFLKFNWKFTNFNHKFIILKLINFQIYNYKLKQYSAENFFKLFFSNNEILNYCFYSLDGEYLSNTKELFFILAKKNFENDIKFLNNRLHLNFQDSKNKPYPNEKELCVISLISRDNANNKKFNPDIFEFLLKLIFVKIKFKNNSKIIVLSIKNLTYTKIKFIKNFFYKNKWE